MSSCPSSLRTQIREPLDVLNSAINELATSYCIPIPVLVPRPALILTGYIASSVYLLDHAIWAHTNGEADNEIDANVFRRWVLEGGAVPAIDDLKRAKTGADERATSNASIVFGRPPRTAKL